MQKLVLLTLLISLSGVEEVSAAASCLATGCTGKIVELLVTTDDSTLVKLEGDMSKLNCSLVSKVFMTLPGESKKFDAVYSALLTAYAVGKEISVRIEEESDNCRILYIKP